MRKALCLAITLVLVFGTMSLAYAGNTGEPQDLRTVRSLAPLTRVVEHELDIEKQFVPQGIDGEFNILSNPFWRATCKLAGMGVFVHSPRAEASSQSYTDSSMTTPLVIDYVFAKARLYINDTIRGNEEDGVNNSSRADATAYPDGNTGILHSAEALTNHTFQHSGYQTWSTELSDKYR